MTQLLGCAVLSYFQLIPRTPNSQSRSFSLHQVDPIRQTRKSQLTSLPSLLEAGCSRAELRFASLCAALPQSQGISVEVTVTRYPSWLFCVFPHPSLPLYRWHSWNPRRQSVDQRGTWTGEQKRLQYMLSLEGQGLISASGDREQNHQ